MDRFMDLPSDVMEKLDNDELVLLKGGVGVGSVPSNNADGICEGFNNSGGRCNGPNNSGGRCDGINNSTGLCGADN